MKKVFALLITLIIALILPFVANAEIRMQDNFEYEASRTGTGGDAFVNIGPWTGVKSINSTMGRGCGYIYTTNSIPGFSGRFPGNNSNRVAVLEFLPATLNCYVGPGNCPNSPGNWLQTDAYLHYGSNTIGFIPANTWIQFWVYLQRYGNQMSRFYKGKWLYSCPEEGGTCPYGAPDWMGVFKEETSYSPFNESTTAGNTYFSTDTQGSGVIGHNKYSRGGLLEANKWHLIKINYDMRNSSSGVWRMWKRTQAESAFTLIAEWVGGVTPGFTYMPSNTSGQRWLKVGTTLDCYDSWWYYDDFVIATSEADLPTYGSSNNASLTPPSNFRIAQ